MSRCGSGGAAADVPVEHVTGDDHIGLRGRLVCGPRHWAAEARRRIVPNTFSIDPATGETAAAGYRSVRVLRLVRRR